MLCENCSNFLSILDLNSVEWDNEVEEFIFICPFCQKESKLVSFLFEQGHINIHYLELIALDTEELNQEKYLDYIPDLQKDFLISHLSSCSLCSYKLETMRLNKIYQKFEFNENSYTFFMSKAKSVSKTLDQFDIKIVNNTIESFLYNNTKYYLFQKNLIYYKNIDNSFYSCYFIELNKYIIGMVSFIKSKKIILLDKIWLKPKEIILKEKKIINNLKCSDIKILFGLTNK
ncbi:MAG: hypothetical protein PHF86_07275 [Candidatus Nanoarchaeia archaeon]|jgi:hypothetical protein|nr:hypothetical protein [Candidatus Nanoarchaeia archaeon]